MTNHLDWETTHTMYKQTRNECQSNRYPSTIIHMPGEQARNCQRRCVLILILCESAVLCPTLALIRQLSMFTAFFEREGEHSPISWLVEGNYSNTYRHSKTTTRFVWLCSHWCRRCLSNLVAQHDSLLCCRCCCCYFMLCCVM